MAGRVQDKVTIITGAASGIGQACFELFAREGATVIGCGRRLAPLEENLAKVQAAGGQGMVMSADLAKVEDANRVVEETIKTYGRVDVLVHCASVGWKAATALESFLKEAARRSGFFCRVVFRRERCHAQLRADGSAVPSHTSPSRQRRFPCTTKLSC